MIEFLPPRDHAFGEADTADFVGFDGTDDTTFDDEPPRSRWLTVLAVVGVTGLLAGGVIAAAPWETDEAADVAPPTTVVRELDPPVDASASVDDPTTPDLATGTPGWLPRSPSRFELARAASNGRVVPGGDSLFMWTSVNATRTSGRWVVVDERGASAYRDLMRDATVIDVGGRRGLLAESDDGVVELRVQHRTGDDFAVISYGLDLDEVLAVAGSVERAVDGTGLEMVVEGTSGTSGTAELVRFAADLAVASTDDWADAIALESTAAWVDPTTLGGTPGGSWGAGATDVWYYLEAGSSFTNRTWPSEPGRTVTTLRTFDEAFVLVADASDTAQSVLVTQPSGSQKTGLTRIDGSERSAAALRIEPDEPFEVTWLDGAGQPIADG